MRTSIFWFLAAVSFLSVGCAPVLISSAISGRELEHSAYTEYLFGVEERNAARTNQPPEPLMSQSVWATQVFRPRLAYARYRSRLIESGADQGELLSFPEWKEKEYPKILAQEEEAVKSPRQKK